MIALGTLGRWTGGGTPSKANPAFWVQKGIPWVSPKDMKRPLKINRRSPGCAGEAPGV
jgi:hypothetical protein